MRIVRYFRYWNAHLLSGAELGSDDGFESVQMLGRPDLFEGEALPTSTKHLACQSMSKDARRISRVAHSRAAAE